MLRLFARIVVSRAIFETFPRSTSAALPQTSKPVASVAKKATRLESNLIFLVDELLLDDANEFLPGSALVGPLSVPIGNHLERIVAGLFSFLALGKLAQSWIANWQWS